MTDLYNFIKMVGNNHKVTVDCDDGTFHVFFKTQLGWYSPDPNEEINLSFDINGNFKHITGIPQTEK